MHIPHKMISASAGSGKTYQLTNRFIEIMACGVAPERIIALTFTRKAAGEFFDAILNKLADASLDAAKAHQLGKAIGRPEWTKDDFLELLANLLSCMPKLTLGTLDSFFSNIVRNFPFELGLSGDFEMMDDNTRNFEKQQVLTQVFRDENPEVVRDFVQAFKLATFGNEEKSLVRKLNQYIDENHDLYLANPNSELWGNRQAIWPENYPWAEKIDLKNELNALRALLAANNLAEKQENYWKFIINELENWSPGISSEKLKTFIKNAMTCWSKIGAGSANMTVERKKQELGPEWCQSIKRIITYIFHQEISTKLHSTKGIFHIISHYECVYKDLVRKAGKLTFNDIILLLAQNEDHPEKLLSSEANVEARLMIDYRLDAKYEHWLLDEFQDTSLLQWSILSNLIDEVIQDPSGQRSFFCVGDIKQAIYSWRGGDSGLFEEIYKHYQQDVEREVMTVSWRSAPQIISCVNHVFGDKAVMKDLFPENAVNLWESLWEPHVSQDKKRNGYAALFHSEGDQLLFLLFYYFEQERHN